MACCVPVNAFIPSLPVSLRSRAVDTQAGGKRVCRSVARRSLGRNVRAYGYVGLPILNRQHRRRYRRKICGSHRTIHWTEGEQKGPAKLTALRRATVAGWCAMSSGVVCSISRRCLLLSHERSLSQDCRLKRYVPTAARHLGQVYAYSQTSSRLEPLFSAIGPNVQPCLRVICSKSNSSFGFK